MNPTPPSDRSQREPQRDRSQLRCTVLDACRVLASQNITWRNINSQVEYLLDLIPGSDRKLIFEALAEVTLEELPSDDQA